MNEFSEKIISMTKEKFIPGILSLSDLAQFCTDINKFGIRSKTAFFDNLY
jgi:hypothetical protein